MVNMDSQFIVFNTKTELLRLDVSKIVYFEGDGNYTQIVTINKLKAVCLSEFDSDGEVLGRASCRLQEYFYAGG